MSRNKLRTPAVAALLALAAGSARLAANASPDTGQTDPTLSTTAPVEVEISDFEFQPDTVRVSAGTTVRWVNRDAVGHTSTSDTEEWNSPLLGPGESFSHEFEEEGTYPYHCTPHPFMRGVVVVEPAA